MRILVLDGNENQAVACVRSLARAGHRVLAGADTSWSKAGWSRSCAGSFTYPSPRIDAAEFVEAIATETAKEPGTLVLPMTESSTLPLSEHRSMIEEADGRLILPAHETVIRAFNKTETTRLARSLGIATPNSIIINSSSEASQIAKSLAYPVVLKAGSSEERLRTGIRAGFRATGAPRYAQNSREFIAAYDEISSRCSLVLAQEFIEGTGAGYFVLMNQGEPGAEFAHRRIRDVRPSGSGSALRVSIAPTEAMRDASLRILGALDWHGVAMVEFRIRPDGTPVFLEVNGRFWTSLALATHAGVEFPALLAKMAESGDAISNGGYEAGVRCRWLLGDLRHLVEVWRGAPPGYPASYPSRLRSTIEFVTPVAGTRHDNFELRDPLPELGDWLDFVFRRLPAAARRSSRTRKAPNVQRRYSHS
jgi:predicted ATP-grasp superfamily ATP-dependent carboligase